MGSNQEGFSIVDEKLTYTNVIECLDEESVLSEYVMAEELETFPPGESNPTAVFKSEEVGLSRSEEFQVASSPNDSDLSMNPDELSESILENLPVSPLRDEYQVYEEVSYDEASKNVSSGEIVKKTPDDCVPEKPLSGGKREIADAKSSCAEISRFVSLIRFTLLALLVSGGLHKRFQVFWSSSPHGESYGEEKSMDATTSVLGNENSIVGALVADEFCKSVDMSQHPMEEVTAISNEMNVLSPILSPIPTLDNPENDWGSLLTQLLALALSLCSVTLLTSEQSKEEKAVNRDAKSSRFEDIRLILVECKTSLRRNGRRSRKESDLKGYNMINYERLSVEDLQKILVLLNQPVKGNKQCLIKGLITEYSRQLAFLTKAEINELLAFHDIKLLIKQKKTEMIKALAEAAF